MKIIIADLFSTSHIESLRNMGCDILYNDKLNGESLKQALSQFLPTILVVRSTKVTADHFNACPKLEAVIRAGSGYDTIDVKAANERGVFVANCPGKNSVAVTELCFGLMLTADRRIHLNNQLLKDKMWAKEEFSKAKGLKGRTLGILGFGNIGTEIAKRALAFDMNVLVKSIVFSSFKDSRIEITESLDELLSRSDVLTIHIPGTPSTANMINATFLSKMKKDATLINTSRGTLANEAEIIEFLNANPSFTYATDVYQNEPVEKKCAFESLLAKHPQVIGTHHIGASTVQAEDAIGQEAYRMIVEYKETGSMPNCVNLADTHEKKVIFIKFSIDGPTLHGVFETINRMGIKIWDVKVESFEGGIAGLCKIKVSNLVNEEEMEKKLKEVGGVREVKL